MKVSLDFPWSSAYYPWDPSSEPWQTLGVLDNVNISDLSPSVKYGIMIEADVQTLTTLGLTPSLMYGVKIPADVQNATIEALTPQMIGALWERIPKNSTIWTNIDRNQTNWTKVGSLLWSETNYPWLASYYPWLEGGGDKPSTTYDNTAKPTTSYTDVPKPTAPTYDNIPQPSN